MSHPNLSTALGRVVIDQLVANGIGYFFVSPGSRSAPLAIAAAERDDVEVVVVIDERSAGFMALGVGKSGRGVAALICTSGTALANYMPAVVEASMSGAPMVVVTADRPRQMIGTGVNQTIDQRDFYGHWVKDSVYLETSDSSSANRDWREAIHRVIWTSRVGMPGPVHLNVALEEPLSPVLDDGRTTGKPFVHSTPRLQLDALPAEDDPLDHGDGELPAGRGLVVAGDGEYDRQRLLAAADSAGWPVLATALSGLRGADVVSSYHQILRAGLDQALQPEVVVAVGAIGPDPLLEKLVAGAEHRVRIDKWGRTIDPNRNATALLHADPVSVLEKVERAFDGRWVDAWRTAEREASKAVSEKLEADERLSGGQVVHVLNLLNPPALFVGSSLPIRAVDAHLRVGSEVTANRGVSGIDGSVSTAVGVAIASRSETVGLIGDISAFHDANGMLVDPGEINLILLVFDNRGGGLFDQLPHRTHAPHYERLFITDPDRDLAALASFHKVPFSRAQTRSELKEVTSEHLSAGGISIVQAIVDRDHDLAQRTS